MRRFFLYLILLLTPLGLLAGPPIRVALLVQTPSVEISCRDGLWVELPSGKDVWSGTEASFKAGGQGILVNGIQVKESILIVRSRSPFWLGRRRYRGILEIRKGDPFLDVINILDLEKYLVSVVGSEMPSRWPEEALKAQAVIARTYALKKKDERQGFTFDLVSSVADQAYEGMSGETSSTQEAVDATRGEVLTYGGKLILAHYHADCGGRTEKGENVFQGEFPYLASVACPFGFGSPYRSWTRNYSLFELSQLLGQSVRRVAIEKDMESSRVKSVTLETASGPLILPGHAFRRILGARNLRSTRFDLRELTRVVYVPRMIEGSREKVTEYISKEMVRVRKRRVTASVQAGQELFLIHGSGDLSASVYSRRNPLVAVSGGGELFPVSAGLKALSLHTDWITRTIRLPRQTMRPGGKKLSWVPLKVPVALTFVGQGWGHGVGLCQWGAHGMAALKKGYREILHYYYRDVELRKGYN